MKIATLTYQRHNNIGAMLQCYALQKTILKHGYENEIIDYICDAADKTFSLKSLKVKGIKKYISSCIGVISRIPKVRAFSNFRRAELKLTKKYYKNTIKELNGKYDGYIVGSDNVWNSRLTGLDENYFLAFVSDNNKKASYAASLGLANIPNNERSFFREKLSQFAIITLREEKAANNIAVLINRPVIDVCDPTFLLAKDEWDALAIEPKEKFHYILAYHMSPSISFVSFVKGVAREKGLPIVYVPFPYGFCKCSIKPHIGPYEWLGLVKNANYIITDSFHGCVFSSIYEKNLIIKISQLGERISNLAEKLGLQGRIVSTVEQAIALPPMDYRDIREKINIYKEQGEKNLLRILEHFASV